MMAENIHANEGFGEVMATEALTKRTHNIFPL
jgi:hypothetical protein